MRRDRALAAALCASAGAVAFLGVIDQIVGATPTWWVRLPFVVAAGSVIYLARTGGTDGQG
jgi:hypothetical protein